MQKTILSAMVSVLLCSQAAFAERVLLLKENADALQARIDLIQQSEKEILAEYFSVWNDDQSVGGFALLLEAAKSGKKVKVIMDALSNSVPSSLIANLLKHGKDKDGNQTLEIKVYNKFNLLSPLQVVHRDHAKMLIADGRRLITGGRNIGDKYFGFNTSRNFSDLDILTEGKAANDARQSFMTVWNSKLVSVPNLGAFTERRLNLRCVAHPKDHGSAMRCKQAKQTFEDQYDRMINMQEALFDKAGKHNDLVGSTRDWLDGVESVDDVRFISHDEERLVRQKSAELSHQIMEVASKAKVDLNILSPYLIPTARMIEVFESLRAKNVRVRIITNSLNSTDNLFAQAGYKLSRDRMIKMGIELYEYNGPDTAHAKVAVIDGTTSIVGTYNLDPRSAGLNREVGVFVVSEKENQLAQNLTAAIEEFRDNSLLVGMDGKPQNKDKWDAEVSRTKKVLLQGVKLLVPIVRKQL